MSFESIVVGSGIYTGKIDTRLAEYLMENASSFSNKIRALFVVCSGGDTTRAQPYVEGFVKACQAKPSLIKIFPGRITERLLNEEDYKIEEEVFKRRNEPYEDYERLKRSDCLKFGEEILKT